MNELKIAVDPSVEPSETPAVEPSVQPVELYREPEVVTTGMHGMITQVNY